ncbi:restriction endonuclease subunit S [Vibrio owensii]|uniref:restriction endonuclease subunit S n=1 Tax=Vibrio owensii TaxID=696485 RepID=UPI003AAA872C
MVPNGWQIKTVGHLFEVQLGKMLNKIAKEKYPQYQYLGNSDVRWGYFNLSDLKSMYFNEREMDKFTLKDGDVLMCEGGEVGRCAVWNGGETSIYYQKALHRLRGKGGIVPEYFQFYMSFINGTKLLDDFSTKTSIAHLTREKLLELPVKTPPLTEQRKIAQILSTWDKAIATTEKLIDASKQQKKALMQQLLTGKKRLIDPETGKAFEGDWEEVKLSKLFARVTEKNKGQSANVVTISAQHGLIRQEEFFKKSIASETLDNYFILRKGQFAYNKSYSNGYPMGAIKRLNRYDDAVVTSLYICFEIKNSAHTSSCFMEQYFESGLLNRGLTKVAAEGGRAHGLLNVKPTDFMGLALVVPEIKEQQKIASVLTAADKEIELLEAKLAHFKQEKKALMQQLLTGKRRVPLSS